MNPKAQRVAIAEACGWQPETYWPQPTEPGDTGLSTKMPDYLNDLNAMHEAEKILDWSLGPGGGMFSEQVQKYHSHLVTLTSGGKWDSYLPVTFATAAQRAEAFLRTLNLYNPTT